MASKEPAAKEAIDLLSIGSAANWGRWRRRSAGSTRSFLPVGSGSTRPKIRTRVCCDARGSPSPSTRPPMKPMPAHFGARFGGFRLGHPVRRKFDGGAAYVPPGGPEENMIMNAGEIMTTDVVSVGPDASTQAVAKLLAARGISALPVVDAADVPIGMISEGDLIGRSDDDRRARRDWWLTLLAEGEELHPDFLASLREPEQTARGVMTSPVISVGEDTELSEIAKLLVSHRIKRVPVVRNDRVIGIVSRADLVRAIASTEAPPKTASSRAGGLFAGAIAGIEDQFRHLHDHRTKGAVAEPLSAKPDDSQITVTDFRALVAHYERQETAQKCADQRALAEQRHQRIFDLINRHISETDWRQLVHQAHHAAERGEREFMLLQFPSALCSDGGRAINAEQPGWPRTLRGEAAELYLRWERDLKSQGFPITARVLDFPGGMPGDVGLFLDWA
jgi:CBS domain-containing protein